MNFDFQEHLPHDFADTSRVWIYQSSRLFFISEALEMEDMLNDFAASWKSHSEPVKGLANLFFGRFIVLMADETATGVSGCSTDSSVHLIKSIEEKYKVQMFDRQNLAFIVKDKIEVIPLSQLEYAVENNFINADTLYFNNTVLSKKEMVEKWIIPVKDSWLAKRVNFTEKAG
ncbi:MAG: hypothetical protein IPF72_15660 [Chitinophagaceae bacterium]|nr:hypothetical protein [Chitinophagaceae bacterium]